MKETSLSSIIFGWFLFGLFAVAVGALVYCGVATLFIKAREKRRRKLGDQVFRPKRN